MTTGDEITLQSIQEAAAQKGLALTEEEAAKLLNGVRRNRAMADHLRGLIGPDIEPALTFAVPPPRSGKE